MLQYCDGDDELYPGVSVVRALEERGATFTGASSAFFATSSSKLAMKTRFQAHGVATAPWIEVDGDGRGVYARMGGVRLVVKPDCSAGSSGISLVDSDDALVAAVAALRADSYFGTRRIFVERFVQGREVTVFLTGSHCFPDAAHVYTPLERVISAALPPHQRFLSYALYWGLESLPGGGKLYENVLLDAHAESALVCELQRVAWEAHCACEGTGYSRVDIRIDDETGEALVLEVNANCSISGPDDDTSVGRILLYSGLPLSQVLKEFLDDAQRHRAARETVSNV